MIRTTKSIKRTLREGERNRDYYCDFCGWAEDSCKLAACTGCALKLPCRECRDQRGLCLTCAEFDLPEEILLVGGCEKCDIQFNVVSWIGYGGSHYYTHAEYPIERFSKLEIITSRHDFSNRTARPEQMAAFIRRSLKIMIGRHKRAINRRKDKKFLVKIECKETCQRLMKYGILSGD